MFRKIDVLKIWKKSLNIRVKELIIEVKASVSEIKEIFVTGVCQFAINHQKFFCLEYVSSETNKTHGYKIRFSSRLQAYYKSCFTKEKVSFYNKIPLFIVSKNYLGNQFT